MASIQINDELMRKLEQKSNATGLKISELVENYLTASLNDATSENISYPINHDDGLENIIGIAQAGYTDDAVQLKKDTRRF